MPLCGMGYLMRELPSCRSLTRRNLFSRKCDQCSTRREGESAEGSSMNIPRCYLTICVHHPVVAAFDFLPAVAFPRGSPFVVGGTSSFVVRPFLQQVPATV
jgi:hypothetical protein